MRRRYATQSMNRGATTQILKVDVAGRVWTPREKRAAILAEFERSGMPATKFAEHIGVKYSTFASWVQSRRKQRATVEGGAVRRAEPAALKWVEATVEASAAGAIPILVVHLPGGARIEVADASQVPMVAALLRTLMTGGAGC